MKIKPIPTLLLIAAASLIVFGILRKKADVPLKVLPFLGPSTKDSSSVGEVKVNYHTIGDFTFIDQMGNPVTHRNFQDKIYVADYFFCTCQSICPIMSKQMSRVADYFAADDRVRFISHTVNPEYDSVNVLADYAKAHHARYGQWYLVTGDKKALYDLARKSYLLEASQGDGGPDDFIHTQNFALIDTQKRIRGFYDGTDSTSMNLMIGDMEVLLKECFPEK